jgi:hypothetical protein
VTFRATALLFLFAALGIGAVPQTKPDSWESKPVDQWADKDVKAILLNSAWGRSLFGMCCSGQPVTFEKSATFRLHSALPMRLAAIRKLQLNQQYDSMDEKRKAEFDKKYRDVLECALCEKYYIVAFGGEDSLTLRSSGRIQRRSGSIYLSNEKGERRTLARFIPQKDQAGEALFYFPRNNDKGEPLLTPKNTTVTFNFVPDEPDDESFIRFISKIETKVQDLVREGKVIF